MYHSITARNFRCFEQVTVEPLRRVNLVVGKNNSGKSSLLEAFFLLGGGADARYLATLGQLRGQIIDAKLMDGVWRPVFHQLRPDRQVVIEAVSDTEPMNRSLTISADRQNGRATTSTTPPPVSNGIAAAIPRSSIRCVSIDYRAGHATQPIHAEASIDPATGQLQASSFPGTSGIPTTLISARSYPSLAHLAGQLSPLIQRKLDIDVLEAVRVIDQRIQRVSVLADSGGATVYADIGLQALVPLAASGDGAVRLFSIAVELIRAAGGVLLIDELENGLHHTVLDDVWRLLGRLAESHDVQIVATTHSDELLRSAIKAFSGAPESFGLFRIDRRDDGHAVASYDSEAMEAVLEAPFEVRG